MYDEDIVGSKAFDHLPAYSASPLNVGHNAIQGMYVYGNAAAHRRSKAEVVDIYKSTSDTRGEPIISLISKFMNIFNAEMPSVCPPGVACKDSPITASPGLLNMWETNYA